MPEEIDGPVNLYSPANRAETFATTKEGDILWIAEVSVRWSGKSLAVHLKPIEAIVKNVGTHGLSFVVSNNTGKRLGISQNGVVTRHKDECEHFYDLKIIAASETLGKLSFKKKMNMLKNLKRTPAPTDQALNDALDWQDTLDDVEKGHIKKLIEMKRGEQG